MAKVVVLTLLCSVFAAAQYLPERWKTPYEKSGFVRTPRYAETMDYCRQLEKASPWIKVTSFGKSPEGLGLPLIIASKEKAFLPQQALQSGKAILLIQNGIHAGEIDGKDACLMLLRDIAITKTKAHLLDNVILLIIPIYNVDGHERFGTYNRINQNGPEEMGWRVTGQNLNLNRDYMKADAPETQAWLRLVTAWVPDFLIDCHVTDGADYQHIVTYGIEEHSVNVVPPVRSWLLRYYQPMLDTLKTGGIPIAPYIFLRDDTDPLKGCWGGTSPPRFSTTYYALRNRPALLIETHMLKPYKERVDGTYALLDATLRILNEEHRSLRDSVHAADDLTAKGVGPQFPLVFQTLETPNQTMHYMGFRQKNEKSDISGGIKVTYTKEPFEADIPRYDSISVRTAIVPPFAYIIPSQWKEVIHRLQLHGVQLERLKEPTELNVQLYRFSNPKWQQSPYEGRHPVTYDVGTIEEKQIFPAGSIVVPMAQRAARLAVHALEPQAPDAFVAWGFFDAIFEQKEYAENYVMEPLADSMLANNAALKLEFDRMVQSDTAFAHSPGARLNFFYQHSPYWDQKVKVYPVARLMTRTSLPTEPVRPE